MERTFARQERSVQTMSALVCGLDVHRDSTYATILDCDGKLVSQRRISNEMVLSYLSYLWMCVMAASTITHLSHLLPSFMMLQWLTMRPEAWIEGTRPT